MAAIGIDQWVWLPDKKEVFIPARVTPDTRGTRTILETINKDLVEYETSKLTTDNLEVASLSDFKGQFFDPSHTRDLTKLPDLTDGSVLYALKTHFFNDVIYNNIGDILVSMNPFKYIPEIMDVTPEMIRKYSVRNYRNEEPHFFQSGAALLEIVMNHDHNASLIVSGESGAGKTVTTKCVLDYLCQSVGGSNNISELLMDTNPIFEAFGNAKTVRNNNSSRFGKWIDIILDTRTGIQGCVIMDYLLEKIRVMTQSKQERNYHIFYQFLKGNSNYDKYLITSSNPKDYRILNQSGCLEIPNVDDIHEYHMCMNSMKQKFQFNDDFIDGIHYVLSAILHLGNIDFKQTNSDQSFVTPKTKNALHNASQMLHINEDDLEQALISRRIQTGNETLMTTVNEKGAVQSVNSLCMTLYDQMFKKLVQACNEKLMMVDDTTESNLNNNNGSHSSMTKRKRHIGILDIFGFEIFQSNQFEQFMINHANEKLQFQFNNAIFKVEQEEYLREGVNIEHIQWTSNLGCIKMVESKKRGLIKTLAEELNVPGGSDAGFKRKSDKLFSKNEYYDSVPKDPVKFIVHHYAADVEYTTEEFLEKTKNRLYEHLTELMKHSQHSFISQLFDDENYGGDDGNDNRDEVSPSKRNPNQNKKQTLGESFVKDLDRLINDIDDTQPRYVRCIKPNDEKQPRLWDATKVIRQMRAGGLFAAISIRHQGFAHRKTFEEFSQRYQCILNDSEKEHSNDNDRHKCESIIDAMKPLLDLRDIQIGQTKVFYRDSQLGILESKRDEILKRIFSQTQGIVRASLDRITFKQIYNVMRKLKILSEKNNENENEDKDNNHEQIKEALAEYASIQNLLCERMPKMNQKYLRIAQEKLEQKDWDDIQEMADDLETTTARRLSIPQDMHNTDMYQSQMMMDDDEWDHKVDPLTDDNRVDISDILYTFQMKQQQRHDEQQRSTQMMNKQRRRRRMMMGAPNTLHETRLDITSSKKINNDDEFDPDAMSIEFDFKDQESSNVNKSTLSNNNINEDQIEFDSIEQPSSLMNQKRMIMNKDTKDDDHSHNNTPIDNANVMLYSTDNNPIISFSQRMDDYEYESKLMSQITQQTWSERIKEMISDNESLRIMIENNETQWNESMLSEIQGTWTARFMAKRKKIQQTNQLFDQRMDFLGQILELDLNIARNHIAEIYDSIMPFRLMMRNSVQSLRRILHLSETSNDYSTDKSEHSITVMASYDLGSEDHIRYAPFLHAIALYFHHHSMVSYDIPNGLNDKPPNNQELRELEEMMDELEITFDDQLRNAGQSMNLDLKPSIKEYIEKMYDDLNEYKNNPAYKERVLDMHNDVKILKSWMIHHHGLNKHIIQLFQDYLRICEDKYHSRIFDLMSENTVKWFQWMRDNSTLLNQSMLNQIDEKYNQFVDSESGYRRRHSRVNQMAESIESMIELIGSEEARIGEFITEELKQLSKMEEEKNNMDELRMVVRVLGVSEKMKNTVLLSKDLLDLSEDDVRKTMRNDQKDERDFISNIDAFLFGDHIQEYRMHKKHLKETAQIRRDERRLMLQNQDEYNDRKCDENDDDELGYDSENDSYNRSLEETLMDQRTRNVLRKKDVFLMEIIPQNKQILLFRNEQSSVPSYVIDFNGIRLIKQYRSGFKHTIKIELVLNEGHYFEQSSEWIRMQFINDKELSKCTDHLIQLLNQS